MHAHAHAPCVHMLPSDMHSMRPSAGVRSSSFLKFSMPRSEWGLMSSGVEWLAILSEYLLTCCKYGSHSANVDMVMRVNLCVLQWGLIMHVTCSGQETLYRYSDEQA
jgi:hypothetical protein